MHHFKIGKKLNRNSSHRKSMFCNMIISLIEHEIIKTTIPKAKELRRIVEPIITLSKIDNISNRRLIFSKIHNKKIINKLFKEIGPYFKNRKGGYSQILRCGFRTGDFAPMAYIKLTGRNIFFQSKHLKDINKNT